MARPNETARNERRKITATAVNNLGVSLVVAGVIVPVSSLAYQFTGPRDIYWIGITVLSSLAGLILHLASRQLLRRIEE